MDVVDEQEAVRSLNVGIAVDFVFPGIAEYVSPPQEQRFVPLDERIQFAEEIDVLIIKEVDVAPELGKEQVRGRDP